MDHLAQLRREGDAFLAAIGAAPLDAPVPSCPGWTVRDLAGHVGVIMHRHSSHLLRGETSRPPGEPPTPPTKDVVGWAREGIAAMISVLGEAGTDLAAWTFHRADRTTGFWHRRMPLELLIHRWDAQRVMGEPTSFDAALAAEGIHEVLEVFVLPRRSGEEPSGTVVLRAGAHPAIEVPCGADPSAARAVLAGSTEEVLLALWGRIPLDDVLVEGDAALAATVVSPA